MFSRFVDAVERHARWVLIAWIAAAVVLTLAAPSLNDVGSQDTADFLPSDAPSQQTDRLLAELFPDDPTRDASIIVVARDGGLTDADRAYLGELDRRGSAGPENSRRRPGGPVRQHQRRPRHLPPVDRRRSRAARDQPASGPRCHSTAPGSSSRIRDHLDDTAPDGLDHHLTGIGGLGADQIDGVIDSFDRTAIVTVVLVLVILLLIYRSVVAALIPLLSIGLAFLVAQGCVDYAAQAGLKVNTLVGTFIIVMIFGAGTDYCLFLTSRYREDLAAGDPVAVTVRRTTKVIGAVIAASAGTVIVGFCVDDHRRLRDLQDDGPRHRHRHRRHPRRRPHPHPGPAEADRRAGVLAPATSPASAPAPTSPPPAGTGSPTSSAAAPPRSSSPGSSPCRSPPPDSAGYQQSFDLVRDLPAGADARVGFDTVAAHYPGGTISPVYLLIRADGPILDDDRLAAIDPSPTPSGPSPASARSAPSPNPPVPPSPSRTSAQLTGGVTDPAALGFDPATDLTPFIDGLTAPGGLRLTGTLLAQYPADHRPPRTAPRRRRQPPPGSSSPSTATPMTTRPRRHPPASTTPPATALAGSALTGARIDVGGPSAFYADMRQISNDDFRIIVAVIIGAIFVVLALLLRSLVAPFYLLATVILSYAATMGITVAVFQGLLGDPGITFWLGPVPVRHPRRPRR